MSKKSDYNRISLSTILDLYVKNTTALVLEGSIDNNLQYIKALSLTSGFNTY